MKKQTSIYAIVIAVIVIVIIIVFFGHSSSPSSVSPVAPVVNSSPSAPTVPAAVTATVQVSKNIKEYQNSELGFSVKYPSAWEADSGDSGVVFVVPIDKSQVSTVASLQGSISVVPGKCSFPPVTTIQDRGTLKVGDMTLNTISMTNNVQGRTYFNRMSTLQKDSICYLFSFASITLSPSSKGLTGSNLTQAQNNNKAIVSTSDSDFSNVVQSFAFVTGPAGQDETTAAPVK